MSSIVLPSEAAAERHVEITPDETRRNSSRSREEEMCVAEMSDYEAVMDIDRHVYHGLDRLPEHYASYIRGAGVQGFIYKLEGRVLQVGFLSTKLVDGGRSVGTTAGRIAADCRSCGMYGRFRRRILEYVERSPDHPHLTVMTVDNTDSKAEHHPSLMRKYTKVMQRASKVVCIDTEAVTHSEAFQKLTRLTEETLHGAGSAALKILSMADIHAMMSRGPDELRHLFPEGRILLRPSWLPYLIMPENTRLLHEDNNVFLASDESTTQAEKDSLYPGNLLTCGGYYKCQRGICYNLDVFGGTGSTDHLHKHVDWHVTRAVIDAGGRDVFLHIVHPFDLSGVLDKMMATFPTKETGMHYNRELVLEMKIPAYRKHSDRGQRRSQSGTAASSGVSREGLSAN